MALESTTLGIKTTMIMNLTCHCCGFENSCDDIKNAMTRNLAAHHHGLGLYNIQKKNHDDDNLISSLS
jgi:hypothetical protein